MPRVCKVTGKKTEVGMNVSHSHRRTKRTFLPNLQTLKFHSDILGRDFFFFFSKKYPRLVRDTHVSNLGLCFGCKPCC